MLQNKATCIGELDRRITIQEKVITENVYNEDFESGWQNIAENSTPWAKVKERSGNEVYQADKLTDLKVTVFTIRFRTDVTTKNRIVYNGLIYDILTILSAARDGYLDITAEANGIFT